MSIKQSNFGSSNQIGSIQQRVGRFQRLRSLPIEFSLDELDNDLAEVNLIQFGSGTLEGEAGIPIDFEGNEVDMSLIYSIIR
jgi:hypothetical protein